MNSNDFWKLATPFLSLTSNQIAHDPIKRGQFRAILHTIGYSMDNDCVKCISDGKKALKKRYSVYKREVKMAKKKQQFKLKPIKVYKAGMSCTPESVGDAEAIKILKLDPTDIRLFEVYPEDWEKLVNGESKITKEKESE